jgi:hypothetical protein
MHPSRISSALAPTKNISDIIIDILVDTGTAAKRKAPEDIVATQGVANKGDCRFGEATSMNFGAKTVLCFIDSRRFDRYSDTDPDIRRVE